MHTLLLAVAAPLLIAAAPTPEAEVKAAAKAFDQAQLAGDKAVLGRMVADDFIIVRGSGRQGGKQDFIAGWTTPGTTLSPSRSKTRSMCPWVHRPLSSAGASSCAAPRTVSRSWSGSISPTSSPGVTVAGRWSSSK